MSLYGKMLLILNLPVVQFLPLQYPYNGSTKRKIMKNMKCHQHYKYLKITFFSRIDLSDILILAVTSLAWVSDVRNILGNTVNNVSRLLRSK